MHRLISAPLSPMGGRHSPRSAAWWRRSWCRPPSPWSPPESCSGWEPSRRRRRCWRWSRGRWRCRTRRRSPPGSVTSRRHAKIHLVHPQINFTMLLQRTKKRCFAICIKREYSHSHRIKELYTNVLSVHTDSYTKKIKTNDVRLIKGICRSII